MVSPAAVWRRMSMRSRLLLPAAAGIVLTMLGVQAWVWASLVSDQQRTAEQRLEVNMALLKAQLAPLGTEWSLVDGKLALGGHKLENRNDVVDAVKSVAGGVATIFQGDTRIATNVTRPDGSRGVGTRLAAGPAATALAAGRHYQGPNEILGRPHLTVYDPIRDAGGRQIGILFVGVPTGEAQADLDRLGWQTLAGGAVANGLLVVALALLMRWNFRPLTRFAGAMRAVAEGADDTVIEGQDRADELGEMARALAAFAETSRRARAADAEAGRLRAEAAAAERRAAGQAAADFEASMNGALERLNSAAGDLAEVNSTLMAATGRAGALASDTAEGARRASENVQSIAVATEQMSGSIAETTERVRQAASAARQAVGEVERADSTVRSLAESAGRIGDVVSLISDIAGQTNLLALNATIEAARAGEAGKGFAVVANEVKSLATQTTRATDDIARQIGAVQAATDEAVAAIRGIGRVVGEVHEIADTIAGAVAQQADTTREIAHGVGAAATGAGTVSAAAAELSDALGAAQATATRLGATSADVARQRDDLRRGAEDFLRRLKAG